MKCNRPWWRGGHDWASAGEADGIKKYEGSEYELVTPGYLLRCTRCLRETFQVASWKARTWRRRANGACRPGGPGEGASGQTTS